MVGDREKFMVGFGGRICGKEALDTHDAIHSTLNRSSFSESFDEQVCHARLHLLRWPGLL